MKVLFTSLFGSKLYGTDTPESDTDYKSVYLPEITTLLRGRAVKNSVHTTGGDGKNTSEDEDHEYIPLQVFATDFLKGQTYALELAFNAIQHPEQCDSKFYEMCNELIHFITSEVRAMTGYALNQAQKYGIKGTRLNSLKSVSALIDEHYQCSKLGECIAFVDAIDRLCETDIYIKDVVYHGPNTTDPANPIDPGFSVIEKIFGYEIDFQEARKRMDAMLSKYGSRAKQAASNSGNDWKAISHALRIIDQAIAILEHGKLEFPLPKADFYRAVKMGEYEWSFVEYVLATRLDELEYWKEMTTVTDPNEHHTQRFYEWFDEWLKEFYFPKNV